MRAEFRAYFLPQHPGRKEFRPALVRPDHQQHGRPVLPVRAALRDSRHQTGPRRGQGQRARDVLRDAARLSARAALRLDHRPLLTPLGDVLRRHRPGRPDPHDSRSLVLCSQPGLGLRHRFPDGRMQRPLHSRAAGGPAADRPRAAIDHGQLADFAHRRHRQFHRDTHRQLRRLDLRRAE